MQSGIEGPDQHGLVKAETDLLGIFFPPFFFFIFASSFIQRLCGAFRLGCNKPKSERVAEGALVFAVAVRPYLLVSVLNTAINRSHSAETFPLVHFGRPLDRGGGMTHQGQNCALISVSIYPSPLRPLGFMCVPSVHRDRSSVCRP